MDTERYCLSIDGLDLRATRNLLRGAKIALTRHGVERVVEGTVYDNRPALAAIRDCLEGPPFARVGAVRAVQQAFLQLRAIDDPRDAAVRDGLSDRLVEAGHIGFMPEFGADPKAA